MTKLQFKQLGITPISETTKTVVQKNHPFFGFRIETLYSPINCLFTKHYNITDCKKLEKGEFVHVKDVKVGQGAKVPVWLKGKPMDYRHKLLLETLWSPNRYEEPEPFGETQNNPITDINMVKGILGTNCYDKNRRIREKDHSKLLEETMELLSDLLEAEVRLDVTEEVNLRPELAAQFSNRKDFIITGHLLEGEIVSVKPYRSKQERPGFLKSGITPIEDWIFDYIHQVREVELLPNPFDSNLRDAKLYNCLDSKILSIPYKEATSFFIERKNLLEVTNSPIYLEFSSELEEFQRQKKESLLSLGYKEGSMSFEEEWNESRREFIKGYPSRKEFETNHAISQETIELVIRKAEELKRDWKVKEEELLRKRPKDFKIRIDTLYHDIGWHQPGGNYSEERAELIAKVEAFLDFRREGGCNSNYRENPNRKREIESFTILFFN